MSNPTPPILTPTSTEMPDNSRASWLVGIRGAWILALLACIIHFVSMFILDPITEGIEQIDVLKKLVVDAFPAPIEGIAGELLSWFIAVGIKTPLGNLSSLILTILFVWFFVRPILTTLVLAPLSHLVLMITGGAPGGIGATMRAFALNRANVEFTTVAAALGIAFSPLPVVWQVTLVGPIFAFIRGVGLCVLSARLVSAHKIGVVRLIGLVMPCLAISSLVSVFLVIVPWLWVALFCVAQKG